MKIKSNDRMPARSAANVAALVGRIEAWKSRHRGSALAFAHRIEALHLFQILHAIRRWYSGQTMTRLLKSYRPHLRKVMALEPSHAVGAYRGFKVDRDHPLAKRKPGDVVTIPVTRNHGFSSWTTNQAITNRFSGGGKGKVGIIVRLSSPKHVTPVLAPPARTKAWFNALYSHAIGDSYRPTEGEYLIHAPRFIAKIVKIKK